MNILDHIGSSHSVGEKEEENHEEEEFQDVVTKENQNEIEEGEVVCKCNKCLGIQQQSPNWKKLRKDIYKKFSKLKKNLKLQYYENVIELKQTLENELYQWKKKKKSIRKKKHVR